MDGVISSASKLASYLESCGREDWAKRIHRMLNKHKSSPKRLIAEIRNLFHGDENLNDVVLQHAGVNEHYLSWNEKLDEHRSDLARQITEIKL